ncbi:hypothetical protein BC941DRAFT_438549 [Chlamydoabsidia padenii]|nr:hypothetical protein BC941DRAFT_438549 [Chlamydoabsidia padenii]
MDYLDIVKGSYSAKDTITKLYIIATVTFIVALIASLRKVKQVQSLPYPQSIITFTLINGLIFRATSWASLSDWTTDRANLLTSYDYARILFFTISNLTLHLIPIVTAHRLLSFRNQSVFKSGLAGIFILMSYFITFVIFVLNLCCMGVGSSIPNNQQVMSIIFSNADNADIPALATFLHLTNASNMIYWWYVPTYVVLLVKYYGQFKWSYLVFCLLTIVTQLGLTITSFLPNIGITVKIILQYVFVIQLSFINLMIATTFGYQWLPPPIDYFDEEELHDININSH